MNGFDEWRLVSLAPWGLFGAVLALSSAAAIVLLAWRALRREERAARRRILLLLRVCAVGAALVLFFQPAVRLQNVSRLPNHVAVLVDASESMRLAEAPGKPTRAERAARIVEGARPAFDALRAQHKLDFFTFDDRLAPTTEEALRKGVPAGADATRMRETLAQVRARYEGRDLGGIVVISDGVDNGRLGSHVPLDAESLDFLRSLDAPVHTVWTGATGLTDVAVARLYADDFAFVRTAVQIEALVRVAGADRAGWNGRTLPVTLKRDGVPVRTVEVTIAPGQREYKVAFAFTPERVGQYVYEISTPVQGGEAITQNNARAFVLRVIRDKVRVLLVAGRPSWDERFLRALLKHDPNVDLISFFILRTPTDLELTSSDELSLIPFPTEELFLEQLRSFDVVFLQNFNYAPYGITGYLGEIKRYVEEGGGLMMVGGDLSFTLGGWARTPVADVLPVDLPTGEEGAIDRLVDGAAFRPALTAEGRVHPLTALEIDLGRNAARWAELPELGGTNVVSRARPGATVLLNHPSRRGHDGKPLPVLTVGEAGKGRVVALTSDSSWRWGFHGSGDRGRAHQRFYENAIRWMIRDPALSFLRLETAESKYARGKPATLTVRALGPDYRPLAGTEVSLAVTRVGGARPEPYAQKSGRTDEEGEWRVELPAPPPGGYRAVARATVSGRPADAEVVFVVRASGRELEEPEARDDLLRAMASATGGKFRGEGESLEGLAFHPPQVVRVNKHRDVDLWDRWWVLAIAATCLALNWALRRRWGYA